MHVTRQPGFILHRYSYRETSLLLEVFTRDSGRIGLVAKGARRPHSEYRAILNPFQPLILSWVGKGELATLAQAEAETTAIALQGKSLWCGFYLNELLLRLLHRHDPHETLYELYRQTLFDLQEPIHQEIALRLFEKRLLSNLGYGLVLDRDITDNTPVVADGAYIYVLDQGPVARHKTPLAGVSLQGKSLLALGQETLVGNSVLHETKILLRAVLDYYLGTKPLHTRRLFHALKQAHGAYTS